MRNNALSLKGVVTDQRCATAQCKCKESRLSGGSQNTRPSVGNKGGALPCVRVFNRPGAKRRAKTQGCFMSIPISVIATGMACLNIVLLIPANRLRTNFNLPASYLIALLLPFVGTIAFLYLVAFSSKKRRLADYEYDRRRFKPKPFILSKNDILVHKSE